MYNSITCVDLCAMVRHAHLGKTGSADGPAPDGNGPTADAVMAKYDVLMIRPLREIKT